MPAKYDRCVEKVSKQKGVKSAHAICTAGNAGNVKQYRRAKSAHKKGK